MLWNDTLRTGNPGIDFQHEELCWLIDELQEARTKGNLAAALDFLVSYTRTHFRDEESFMETNGYAGLTEHRDKHREFIATVVDFQADFFGGRLEFQTLLDFLGSWLVDHIQQVDITMLKELEASRDWQ